MLDAGCDGKYSRASAERAADRGYQILTLGRSRRKTGGFGLWLAAVAAACDAFYDRGPFKKILLRSQCCDGVGCISGVVWLAPRSRKLLREVTHSVRVANLTVGFVE